jgi:hypothetical protein
MTTVWIYVETNKEVGDADHLKVFATPELPTSGSRRTIRRALLLDMSHRRMKPDRDADGRRAKPRPVIWQLPAAR